MARSSRSSRLRANRDKARSSLYGPKNDEALARLNAKLNEIRAMSPPPPPPSKQAEGERPGEEVDEEADPMATDEPGESCLCLSNIFC
jgi:hypothetical protein